MLVPSSPSRRLVATESGERPVAAWLAGLVLGMLAIGAYGALQPLLPSASCIISVAESESEVIEFQPQAGSASAASGDEHAEPAALEAEVEIPSIPELTPPLMPAEMPELAQVETPSQTSQSKPRSEPPAQTAKAARRAAAEHNPSRGTGEGPVPVLMTGGIGGGRFPAPSYPAAARSLREQGLVRLLVTVETSGFPTSVDILSSSGSGTLDYAALDQVRRRWHWPAGPVRKYIAPIRFEMR